MSNSVIYDTPGSATLISLKTLFSKYHLDKELRQFIDLGLKTIEDLDFYKDMQLNQLVEEENVKLVFGQRFFDKKRFYKLINELFNTPTAAVQQDLRVTSDNEDKENIDPQVVDSSNNKVRVRDENENNKNIDPQVAESNTGSSKKQKIWDYDPKYFKRPSLHEKEQLAANNWEKLVNEVGWIKTTTNLCKAKQVPVLIPKYIPKRQKEEIENRDSSNILRKNFHFFELTDKEEIFRYIDRYGVEFRPFEIKEIWDHVHYHGWQWLDTKKKWRLPADTCYIRNGVEIPEDNFNSLILNRDYFLDIEGIVDYFLTLPDDDDDKIPVVGDLGIYDEYKKILGKQSHLC